jgi:hypothetical protein
MVREYILVFISIFIAMGLTSKNNKAMMVYTVTSRKTKFYYIISRMVTGSMLITLICLSQALTFYAITLGFTPFYLDQSQWILVSLYLLAQTFQYHILTMFIMSFTHFNLLGLIPLMFFWYLEVTYHSNLGKINNFIKSFMLNINGYYFEEKSLIIFAIVFIFLTINYIIVLIKKDCTG